MSAIPERQDTLVVYALRGKDGRLIRHEEKLVWASCMEDAGLLAGRHDAMTIVPMRLVQARSADGRMVEYEVPQVQVQASWLVRLQWLDAQLQKKQAEIISIAEDERKAVSIAREVLARALAKVGAVTEIKLLTTSRLTLEDQSILLTKMLTEGGGR